MCVCVYRNVDMLDGPAGRVAFAIVGGAGHVAQPQGGSLLGCFKCLSYWQ